MDSPPALQALSSRQVIGLLRPQGLRPALQATVLLLGRMSMFLVLRGTDRPPTSSVMEPIDEVLIVGLCLQRQIARPMQSVLDFPPE